MEYERPDEPDFFIKPPASLVGHEDPVPYPQFSDEVTYAGELSRPSSTNLSGPLGRRGARGRPRPRF